MSCVRFALALLALTALLSAADPAAGTWKLNIAKSKFSPGPPPQSATLTYEDKGNGVRRTGESVSADGTRTSFEYAAEYDGKDYPITGNLNADTVSLKRVDDRTVEATLKKGGKTVSHARRVLSPDGKTLTLTVDGTNAKGEKTHNVQIFERQ